MIFFKKGDNKEIAKSINFNIDIKESAILLFSIFKFSENIVLIISILIKTEKEIII